MNVSLTSQLDRYVQELVASGRYGSASEVVRAALRALEREETEREQRLRALRRDVEAGLADLDAGRLVPNSPELSGQVRQQVIKQLEQRLSQLRSAS